MRTRRLSPEEQALWARVARTARPMPGKRAEALAAGLDAPIKDSATLVQPDHRMASAVRPAKLRPAPARALAAHRDTLDGRWDKRIAKGDLAPDVTIDLHGETLATAHVRLNRGLDAAIRHGDRTILLITGKPAVDNPRLPPTSRGVIRASVMDWLAASVHADRIAAVRNAHPRHGGAGALYIILRRARETL